MRILLVRHGPSAHSATPAFADRAAVEQWLAGYDAAAIKPGASPPRATLDIVAEADVAVASDLPRAIASGAQLWPARSVESSPLFREIPLAIPALGGMRLPFALWPVLIHLRWGFDLLRGRDLDSAARARLDQAAEWCETTCEQHGQSATLAIVTHGVFRSALARELVRRGWRLGPSRGYSVWGVWALTR